MIKSLLKTCTLILLLFNAAGALYGGYHLVNRPDGSGIGLPLTLLRNSCFDDFLIPGIILFIFNGLYGLFVSAAVIFNARLASFLVIIQGFILLGWIIIQLLLIKTFSPFHIILGAAGLLLIILGFVQGKKSRQPAK